MLKIQNCMQFLCLALLRGFSFWSSIFLGGCLVLFVWARYGFELVLFFESVRSLRVDMYLTLHSFGELHVVVAVSNYGGNRSA